MQKQETNGYRDNNFKNFFPNNTNDDTIKRESQH